MLGWRRYGPIDRLTPTRSPTCGPRKEHNEGWRHHRADFDSLETLLESFEDFI